MSRWLTFITAVLTTFCVACGSATPAAPPIPTAVVQSPPAVTTSRPVTIAPVVAAGATATSALASGSSAESQLTGQFANPLATIEDLDTLQIDLGRIAGVTNVTGSETTLTITYDASRVTPERLRQVLADLEHPIR